MSRSAKVQREWRRKHPEKVAQYQQAYRERYPKRCKRSAREAYKRAVSAKNKLKDKPCSDCGIKYPPYVMDFDHVRGKKHHNVGEVARVAAIIKEAKKCDVVCSNCHRERTHKRLVKRKSE